MGYGVGFAGFGSLSLKFGVVWYKVRESRAFSIQIHIALSGSFCIRTEVQGTFHKELDARRLERMSCKYIIHPHICTYTYPCKRAFVLCVRAYSHTLLLDDTYLPTYLRMHLQLYSMLADIRGSVHTSFYTNTHRHTLQYRHACTCHAMPMPFIRHARLRALLLIFLDSRSNHVVR